MTYFLRMWHIFLRMFALNAMICIVRLYCVLRIAYIYRMHIFICNVLFACSLFDYVQKLEVWNKKNAR